MSAPSRPAVLAAGPRLAARAQGERSERRRRLSRRVALALAVLAAVGLLAWAALASPLLAVDRVVVTGTERLTAAQVTAVAQVEPGTPMARVSTLDVVARLRALPEVAGARVSRSWGGTVRIAVVERRAAAAVAQGGSFRLLDEDGVPFATAPKLPAGTVRLALASPSADDPATRAALAVLRELPPALRGQVREVRATSPDAVALLLPRDRTLVWGAPGDAPAKAAAAGALLRLGGHVFDVSDPRVVTRR
jgi:cell division protein FtsQ